MKINPQSQLVTGVLKQLSRASIIAMALGMLLGQDATMAQEQTLKKQLGEEPVENTVQDWISETLRSNKKYSESYDGPLSDEQVLEQLEAELKESDELRYQICALKLLVERYPVSAIQIMKSVVRNTQMDKNVRCSAISLLGMYRIPEHVNQFAKVLDEKEPEVLIAALDAIGYTIFPLYDREKFGDLRFLKTDPMISTWRVRNAYFRLIEKPDLTDHELFAKPYGRPQSETSHIDSHVFTSELRQSIVDLMVSNQDSDVREAAARTLVVWPEPSCRFRFAEWGVWLSSGEKLELVQTVIDEIPEFVYRCPEKIESLSQRVNKIMVVTKPIIHVSVDRPLAFYVEVNIRMGQVWFAYPNPNDYQVLINGNFMKFEGGRVKRTGFRLSDSHLEQFRADLLEATDRAKQALNRELEPHVGYACADDELRTFGEQSGSMGSKNVLTGSGILWQSVIATPQKADWMNPPLVPEENRWWSDLRSVDSGWISSRGQSEKFLYYDGPTIIDSPYEIELRKQDDSELIELNVTRIRDHKRRILDPDRGLWIQVDQEGKLAATSFLLEGESNSRGKTEPKSLAMTFIPELRGEAVIAKFKSDLIADNGLTDSEADGLIGAWRKQFFETPGERVILRFSKAEYDYCCPIIIRPTPTEFARVGLILHETPSKN